MQTPQPSTHSAPSARPGRPSTTGDEAGPLPRDALQALKSGNPGAFERWVYVHRDFVLRFLLKIVKDRSVASELVQETFFQALRSLSSFRGDSKVSTWLCGIARNLAYKHFRAQDRYTTAESDTLEFLNQTVPGAPRGGTQRHPRRNAERTERTELLHAALDQLPASYREIIRMRDLQERSTQEVAEALNLTRVNVRVRLHRARKKLKGLLAPQLSARGRAASS
jgi:RNA polymerase sigma-70 factor (ECF subfamily)